MKKLSLTSLLIIITLGFSSCTQEESTFLEEPTSAIFGKLVVSRDDSGAYSMDLKTKDDIASDIAVNNKGNGKDIYLYNSLGENPNNVKEDLSFGKQDSFSIGIENTISNNKSRLTIFDDDIQFAKTETEEDHLNSYSITDNGNGTYDLAFTVDANIEVDFIQNEDTGVYEIHLEPGNGTQSNFSRTFTKETGSDLEIVFVNYFESEDDRSVAVKIVKPKTVVEDGPSVGA